MSIGRVGIVKTVILQERQSGWCCRAQTAESLPIAFNAGGRVSKTAACGKDAPFEGGGGIQQRLPYRLDIPCEPEVLCVSAIFVWKSITHNGCQWHFYLGLLAAARALACVVVLKTSHYCTSNGGRCSRGQFRVQPSYNAYPCHSCVSRLCAPNRLCPSARALCVAEAI